MLEMDKFESNFRELTRVRRESINMPIKCEVIGQVHYDLSGYLAEREREREEHEAEYAAKVQEQFRLAREKAERAREYEELVRQRFEEARQIAMDILTHNPFSDLKLEV
jgi:hypothetical protein